MRRGPGRLRTVFISLPFKNGWKGERCLTDPASPQGAGVGGKQGAIPSGPCVHVTFPTWAGQLLAHPSGGAEERGGRGRTGKQAPGQFPHGGMGGGVQGLGAREETAARSKCGNIHLFNPD